MRPLALAAILLALALPAAHAAADAAPSKAPQIPDGASYSAARQTLIRHGFSPVPIQKRETGSDCPGGMCRTFPEVLDCSQGLQHCAYLYRDAAGAYWQAFSVGEDRAPPYPRVAYAGLRRATRSDLEGLKDYVISGPDGRPFRLQLSRPAPLPAFRPNTPYADARRQLAAQGYEPVRVLGGRPALVCRDNALLCSRFPELADCTSMTTRFCDFLFRGPTGSLVVLITWGEAKRPEDLADVVVDKVRYAMPGDFQGLALARPATRQSAR